MLIYHYHPETGLYLQSSLADPDPLEHQLARNAVYEPLAQAAQAAYDQALLDTEQNEDPAVTGVALAAAAQNLQLSLAAAQAAADAVPPTDWLIPANATTQAPPAFGWDEQAVWADGGWSIVPVPEPEPEPEPDPEDLAAAARVERNRRIERVRPLIERHRDEVALGLTTTWTNEDYLLVLQRVQDLRDVPEQDGFPVTIDWPALPPELLETGA